MTNNTQPTIRHIGICGSSDKAGASYAALQFREALARHVDGTRWEWNLLSFRKLHMEAVKALFPNVDPELWPFIAGHCGAMEHPVRMFAYDRVQDTGYADWACLSGVDDNNDPYTARKPLAEHLRWYPYYVRHMKGDHDRWVNQMADLIDHRYTEKFIIDDVHNWEDHAFIKARGGLMVYVDGGNTISPLSIKPAQCDLVLRNYGKGRDQLRTNIHDYVKTHFKQLKA